LRQRAKHVQVSLDESTGGPQPVSVSERLADHRPNPEDEYRKSELSTRLTHLHSQLSPTLPRTFQLRDVDGLSIRETAQILGVPTGTVKAQSARARQKLKELMRRTLRPQYRRLPLRLDHDAERGLGEIGGRRRRLHDRGNAREQGRRELFEHAPHREVERVDVHRRALERGVDVLADERALFRQALEL